MKKTLLMLLVLACCLVPVFAGGDSEAIQESTGEKPVLNILNYNVAYNMTAAVEYQVIEEVSGYKVNYEVLPSEHASEILMLNLSMDNNYDAVVIQEASDFQTLMSAGALLPLNDYIDEFAPELWNCAKPEVWEGVSDAEGNVYALPSTSSIKKEVSHNMSVRMDLVEKAGLGRELPSTISEFYEFCKKLKDFYGDEYIILTGPDDSNISIPQCFLSAFGITNDWMLDENGKVIYMTEHENFPALIEYMNRLYTEGILDPDFAINNMTTTNEKFASGRAIICMNSRGTINPTSKSLFKNVPGLDADDIGYIPYLHADDGSAVIQLNEGYSIFTLVPRGAADTAEHVIKYAASKVENQELFFIGEEGVHFIWDEDGYPTPIQPTFTDERNKANNYLMIKNDREWETQFYCRLRKDEMIWRMFSACSIDVLEEDPNLFTPAHFAYNTSTDYKKRNPSLLMNLNTYLIQLVTGVKDLDSSYSTFVKDFTASGGENVRAGLQEYIDSRE